jgi:hypothetical protein
VGETGVGVAVDVDVDVGIGLAQAARRSNAATRPGFIPPFDLVRCPASNAAALLAVVLVAQLESITDSKAFVGQRRRCWAVRWNGLEARRLDSREVELNDAEDLLWIAKLPPPPDCGVYSTEPSSPWRELHVDVGWYRGKFRVVLLDPSWADKVLDDEDHGGRRNEDAKKRRSKATRAGRDEDRQEREHRPSAADHSQDGHREKHERARERVVNQPEKARVELAHVGASMVRIAYR